MDSIEQIIKGLHGVVENRLSVIEKGLSSRQNETIQKLTQLLEQERERNQELLRKHARLEMEYVHLKQLVDKARKRAQEMKVEKA